MGMLFNSQGTMEVLAALNAAFAEESIGALRTTEIKGLFAATASAKLSKAAYKLGIWPGSGAEHRQAKRWFKFLKDLPSTVHNGIRAKIKESLENDKVTSIKFMAAEQSTTSWKPFTIPESPGATDPRVVFILLVTAVLAPDDEGDDPN